MIAASPDLLAQLPLSQACAVLAIGRGSYYRQLGKRCGSAAAPDETGLRAAIEQVDPIALTLPGDRPSEVLF